MPVITSGWVFPTLMWLIILLWMFFLIVLIMHFLMPKAVLDKYFKQPHFREAECHIFSGFPFAPMRTIMFMGVFAFPKLGKKRNLAEAYLLAPVWFRLMSKFVLISILLALFLILLLAFGFYFYNEFLAVKSA